ncbi:alpha/beta fold hydrolase [Methylobacterium durans]|uniref:Alpha/beta hydrolase n=1 Tax=Methylobacterium durans TaxID=2202825 RepID=A0A2U8W6Z6_9HYPH|nr:alpha/beta hydrolase [Methylobacterium durans]AWN41864.1 alpha/beta hydrolase [Methylobacterium durans]
MDQPLVQARENASRPHVPALGPSDPVARAVVTTPSGHRVAYVEAGEGPDLVLIHGALMVLDDMWLGPMSVLARHFRVIAFDRPGHGGSSRARLADATPWRQAEILGEAMDALGLRRPLVAGHSFGGAVALALGLGRPEALAGVLALAPICFPEARLEQVLFGPRAVSISGDMLAHGPGAALDSALLPLLWRAMFLPQRMPEVFAARFPFAYARRPEAMIANGEDAAALWPGLTRSAFAYATCRCPVHVLTGNADLVVSPHLHGRTAARLIPGARHDALDGVGHMLHHARADAVVAAALGLARP